MGKEFENVLRKGMIKLGHAVEAVIGHAQKAKGSVSHVRSVRTVEPILAIESQLSMPKIKELISTSVERVVRPLVPNLIDKAAIEVCDGPTRFGAQLKEKGVATLVHVDIGGAAGGYPKELGASNVSSIRASIRSLPFEDEFFDYCIANLATARQGDVIRSVKEIGRQIVLGGSTLIVDFHPFGMFAKKGNLRLRSPENVLRGVEDYYKICHAAGLNITAVKEAFIDETLRGFFETPEEKSAFRQLKDTPFLIFFAATKKGS